MYITGAIANKNIIYVTKAVVPFLVIQIAVLFLMTYLPDLVLWLPKMMGFWEAIDTSMPAL
jgi:C4-dicarboxylate transporter DctM subunit